MVVVVDAVVAVDVASESKTVTCLWINTTDTNSFGVYEFEGVFENMKAAFEYLDMIKGRYKLYRIREYKVL